MSSTVTNAKRRGWDKLNLYNLVGNYKQVLDLISDGEDLGDTLESIDGAIEDKVENIAKVIKSLEAEVVGYKTEESRLSNRRKSIENNIIRLKEYTQQSMETTGKIKIKGDLFTVAIQNNPQSVKILDESLIPKSYYEPQEPKLNRRELLDELKLGHEVHGVEIQQTQSLRIR